MRRIWSSVWGQVVLLLAASAVAGAVTMAVHPRAPALYLADVPLAEGEVDLATVDARWGGDVLWIDARTREQFEAGHVPGAILLNEQDWDDLLWENVETLQTTTKPVVIYCGSQACQASHQVAHRLRTTVGLNDVWVLRGGKKALGL